MDENIWYYIDDKISWDPRNVSCYHTYTCYKCLVMVKQKTKKNLLTIIKCILDTRGREGYHAGTGMV